MPKVKVYNLSLKGVGELELSDTVFGAAINEGLFYDVLKAQLASRRSGNAQTKNRSIVTGSTAKVYKQKGTGNARHGNKKAPLYVGGGQAHGPQKRSYAYRPPRKMRQGALMGALSLKLKEGRLLILDDFKLKEIKTKKLSEVLGKLKIAKSSLIVDTKENSNLRMSARNLQKHSVVPPEGVNLYDLLRHEHLVLTKSAVEAIEARFASPNSVAAAGE